jgi:hypothetical protein
MSIHKISLIRAILSVKWFLKPILPQTKIRYHNCNWAHRVTVWVYSSLLFAVCILLLRLYIDRLLHWSYCQNQFLMESGCDRVYLEFGSKFYPELRKCRMSVTFVIINSVISVLGGHWLHYTSALTDFSSSIPCHKIGECFLVFWLCLRWRQHWKKILWNS